jgi:hypothetical protein
MSPIVWTPGELSYASCLLAMTKINNINATESRVGQCDGTCHSDDLASLERLEMSSVTILKRPRDESVQTQRKYFRKTAKGKVVKGRSSCQEWRSTEILMPFLVLRERYLRDDIACGIIGLCDSPNPTLPARGDLSHANFPNGHFLLPDTNVFLHQVCSLNTMNLFMA